MKYLKKSSLCILVFLVFISCSKDQDYTGTLNLNFENHPSDIMVEVFSMDNTEIGLYSFKLNSEGKKRVDLNVGNYYLKCYSSTYFPSIGFQIRTNKTTLIRYDERNIARKD